MRISGWIQSAGVSILLATSLSACGSRDKSSTTPTHTISLMSGTNIATPAQMKKTAAIARMRAKALGVSDAVVKIVGKMDIAVELPDRSNSKRLETVLTSQGDLRFYDWEDSLLGPNCRRPDSIDERVTGGANAGQAIAALGEAAAHKLDEKCAGKGIRTTIVEAQRPTGYPENKSFGRYYVLRDNPSLSGTEIVKAEQDLEERSNTPVVQFELTEFGRRAFKKLTRKVAERRNSIVDVPRDTPQHFAIVLDNKILSVPYVDGKEFPEGIDPVDGSQISGGFTTQSARELAVILQTGPLPVSLVPFIDLTKIQKQK